MVNEGYIWDETVKIANKTMKKLDHWDKQLKDWLMTWEVFRQRRFDLEEIQPPVQQEEFLHKYL